MLWANILGAASAQTPATTPAAAAFATTAPAAALRDRWLALLRNPKAELTQRAAAARLLLATNEPGTENILRVELATTPDPATQRAIAQGLASLPPPPAAFAPLLLDLLTSTTELVNADIVSALACYDSPAVIQKLAALALDNTASIAVRRSALEALQTHRTAEVVQVILGAVEVDQPDAVRAAGFAALTHITGINDFGNDLVRWQQWWREHRQLPPALWYGRLFDNFDRSRVKLTNQVQQLQDRLVETERQLYRATPPEKRDALLAAILNDPLDALRKQGMDLAAQTLSAQGPAGVSPQLRKTLLLRLDDPSPDIRLSAVYLLWNLSDDTAADKVAQVLAWGQEPRPDLLRADLILLSRLPRRNAVEPALHLLEDPTLRAEAADMLAAAAEAGFVAAAQTQRALAIVRAQLQQGLPPVPQVVKFLGRIGQDEDWQRIGRWLDDKDNAIREAAALAWTRSSRPLDPLLQRAGDAVIFPILLDAAMRRGASPALLTFLVEHKPAPEAQLEVWQRALVAVAGRAPAAAVVLTDRRLLEQNETTDLRLRVLSTAIEHFLPAPPATNATQPRPVEPVVADPSALADLLLTRAELQLAEGEARAALADVQHILAQRLPLSLTQQRRCDLLLVKARLNLGESDGVFAAAQRLLGPAPHRDPQMLEQLADLILAAAQRGIANAQTERAKQYLIGLRELAAGPLPANWQPRVAQIEAVTGPTTAPAEPTTRPTTQPATTAPAPAATQPAATASAPATTSP